MRAHAPPTSAQVPLYLPLGTRPPVEETEEAPGCDQAQQEHPEQRSRPTDMLAGEALMTTPTAYSRRIRKPYPASISPTRTSSARPARTTGFSRTPGMLLICISILAGFGDGLSNWHPPRGSPRSVTSLDRPFASASAECGCTAHLTQLVHHLPVGPGTTSTGRAKFDPEDIAEFPTSTTTRNRSARLSTSFAGVTCAAPDERFFAGSHLIGPIDGQIDVVDPVQRDQRYVVLRGELRRLERTSVHP